MKRFWTDVAQTGAASAIGITLDGKPVRTPKRAALTLPTVALADAIVAEWSAIGEDIDPRAMPLTGLANAAIDIVAPDPARFAASLASYGETDLLAYRAEAPVELVAAQSAAWDPMIGWARLRYDIHIEVIGGIMHRSQPALTIARLSDATAARPPFALAALSPVVTIGGSLIAALALAEGAFPPDLLWDAVNFDELWQERQWGEDAFATRRRNDRRVEWDAAVRFLGLL